MPESPVEETEQPFHAAARGHHEEAARAWREACVQPAADLDELRRVIRADLADRLLADEWEARQRV